VSKNEGLTPDDLAKESLSGGIYIKARNFTMIESSCSGNKAYKAACFLYEALENFEFQDFLAENCTFEGNDASDYSSVMYSNSFTSNRILIWRNCEFLADWSGWCFFLCCK
jgi:C1A family cysteine protease